MIRDVYLPSFGILFYIYLEYQHPSVRWIFIVSVLLYSFEE